MGQGNLKRLAGPPIYLITPIGGPTCSEISRTIRLMTAAERHSAGRGRVSHRGQSRVSWLRKLRLFQEPIEIRPRVCTSLAACLADKTARLERIAPARRSLKNPFAKS
jgi:hypothetical protein